MQTEDELQGVQVDEVEETETQSPEQGEALATSQDSEPEEKPESDEGKQDRVQQAINRQHAKYREEERKRIAAEQEAERVKQELKALKGEDKPPVVPELPDPYADNFDQVRQEREAAIAQKARWDQQRAYEAQLQEQQALQAQQAELERRQKMAVTFESRAKEMKVNEEALNQALQVLNTSGINQDLGLMLLEDADGPLLVQQLASDFDALDKLTQLPPAQAGAFIEREVRAKAAQLKPRQSEAPAPPETLQGGGVKEQDLLDKNHPGVKIELG